MKLVLNVSLDRSRFWRTVRPGIAWTTVVGFVLAIFLAGRQVAGGDTDIADPAGVEFFETKIRPVLVEHCYQCHSQQVKTPKGNLRLDSAEATRVGGESGHAVVPNDLQASLIISALRYETFEMPPSGPLDDAIIDDFETWILQGAPDPRDKPAAAPPDRQMDLDQARDYWAFQPPSQTVPPALTSVWIKNDVDRFLWAAQQGSGVTPVGDAEPASLLRRVYFDLIGLPPSPTEVNAFIQNPSSTAYENVVDQLLSSPSFGERWGRHWLDVVRYAESTGKTRNFPYPFAWRYRDYVVQSFNADKPYDEFVREQLAGDLLPAETDAQRDQQRIATGFLAIGSLNLNENNNDAFRMEVVGEQVDVMGRALMALTIGCARCHDHKFDPIPTADYYAFAGIFRSTRTLNGYTNRRKNKQIVDPQLYLALTNGNTVDGDATEEVSYRPAAGRSDQLDKDIELTKRQIERLRQQLNRSDKVNDDPARNDLGNLRQRLKAAQRRLRNLKRREDPPPPSAADDAPKTVSGPYAMGVQDAGRVDDCPIHLGGDVKRLGPIVPRGFLQVLSESDGGQISSEHSGRLELANWLTDPNHPLTSRVYVNRVWQHLFGTGIVATVDNFGVMGNRPSHPKLLDFLAEQFVQDGWSTKRMIRRLVLSHAYQLCGQYDDANVQIDADNRLIWRMPPRRLEAEAIRDAILAVSGELNDNAPTGSPIQDLPIAQLRRNDPGVEFHQLNYRSIYLPILRSRVPQYLTTFDFPEPSDVKGSRDVTTVATQALFILNSPFVNQHSRRAAERLLMTHSRPREFIRNAYLLAVGRQPTHDQMQRAVQYWQQSMDTSKLAPAEARSQTATDLIHALIGSAEFRYH